jgi:hypothetical protein
MVPWLKKTRGAGISLVVVLLACGGSDKVLPNGGSTGGGGATAATGSGTTGGGGSGQGGRDESCTVPDGASVQSGCPAVAPMRESVCWSPLFECEYGASPNLDCNVLFVCGWHDAGGFGCPTWMQQGGAPADCPADTCPESLPMITPGDPCGAPHLNCAYPNATCICASGTSGGFDGGDAGWACFPIQPGCPSPRPRIGTPCTDDGMLCDYGRSAGGVATRCQSGVWGLSP